MVHSGNTVVSKASALSSGLYLQSYTSWAQFRVPFRSSLFRNGAISTRLERAMCPFFTLNQFVLGDVMVNSNVMVVRLRFNVDLISDQLSF